MQAPTYNTASKTHVAVDQAPPPEADWLGRDAQGFDDVDLSNDPPQSISQFKVAGGIETGAAERT
jgi:hypothetical protein